MGKLLLALGGLFAALLLASVITGAAQGWGEPSYAELARDYAEAARIEREAARAEALAPLYTLMAAAWAVLPFLVAIGGIAYFASLGVAHVARFRHERMPRGDGLLPVRARDLAVVAPQALGAFHAARQLEAAQQPVPHTLSYAPRTDYRADRAGAALAPADQLPAAQLPSLPGVTDLAALDFTPSMQHILLALDKGGEPITVPMKALWHIGTAGPTGAGKSNIARLIIPQLQQLGAKVCIGDPKWTPFDQESGEDWRPIARRLHLQPARRADEIGQLIGYFHDELERRLDLRNAGQRVGGPLFLYLDEYTTITEDVKNAGERVARLGRLGRGVGIFLLVAAHDLLVKSGAGDTRDQIRTGFYLGGDVKTGSVLLDMSQRAVNEREGDLTTGVALLRSVATSPPRLVRIPYASNAGVAAILTEAQTERQSNDRPESVRNQSGISQGATSDYSASGRGETASAEAARVLALFLAGNDAGAIVTELTGMTSRAGTPYLRRLTEVQAVIRIALAHAQEA